MIASNNLRLRAAEPEDLELAYELENDTELWRLGSTNEPVSRFALKRFLENNGGDIYADRQVRLTIESRGEDGSWERVGFADLFKFEPEHSRAEIGLALLPRFRGKHIGRNAVTLLADYAALIGLHTIFAIISEENKKASHTFERAGFVASARLCDWLWNGNSYVGANVWQKIICHDHDRHRATRP
ncbi:MAG: GNAT family N-acetyltransferase [Bacteroidaceae bacterium]|nr:GNAT family N-acetyltransferase [Bacteroidaceae bacterium]